MRAAAIPVGRVSRAHVLRLGAQLDQGNEKEKERKKLQTNIPIAVHSCRLQPFHFVFESFLPSSLPSLSLYSVAVGILKAAQDKGDTRT
jgi:hypothetical protein